jgi:GNAT superfamily N-acetyltransferase
MALVIRPARPGDAALVFSLVSELAEYEKLTHEVMATEASLAAALFASTPSVFCDIAEWQGEPAGFVVWFRNFSTFSGRHGIYLEDLFVRPAHRRHGIGRALLTHLARRCMVEGWTRLQWSVLDWNTPAIEFYRSLGADLQADWRLCRLADSGLAKLARQGE